MDNDEQLMFSSAAYDVAADNYEEFDQEIDSAKLDKKLIQINTLKGTRRKYQLYAPNHLLLNLIEGKRAKAKSFHINLAWLNPEPQQNKIIAWKWLYGALAAAALACLSLYLGLYPELLETDKLYYHLAAGTITVTASLICSLIFIYLMRDEFIFKSLYGGVTLFLMENNKPSQKEFGQYFIELQQAIVNTQSNISVPDRLVGELKMCRRLRDEGIIDDEAYTIARTAIFKHSEYKS